MNIQFFFFLVSKSKRKRYFPPPDTRPPPAAPSPHSPPLPDSYGFLGPLRDAYHAPSLPYSVPTKLTASGLRGVPVVGRQQRDGKESSCSTSTWVFFFLSFFSWRKLLSDARDGGRGRTHLEPPLGTAAVPEGSAILCPNFESMLPCPSVPY